MAHRRATPPPLPRLEHRPDLQGLRAVAVLLVVLAHAGVPGLTGGYLGVDVFLVLSGFLISSILLHEATTTGRVSLVGFYARRARRILPAATLTLVTVAAASTLLLSYVRADRVLTDVVWAALFGANLRFGWESTDYFTSDQPVSPVQHFWSLAVEEQFYLVWPVLLVLVLATVTRGSSHADDPVRRARLRIRALALVAVGLCALSLAWSVLSTADSPQSAYFSTPARAWELGAGVLLALAGRSLPLLTARARTLLATTGLAAVLLAAVTFTERTPVPGYAMLLPVAGTVALLAAGAGLSEGQRLPLASRWLTVAPMRWIGDLSYGFYLWHWPFLILAGEYLGYTPSLRASLVLVLASLGAAWLSLHLVENPIRRHRTLARRPRRALVLWPTALAVVLATQAGAYGWIEREQRQAEARAGAVDLADVPREQRAARSGQPEVDAVADAVDRATLEAALEAPFTQDLTELEEDRWNRQERCVAGPDDETSHEICPVGDLDAERSVVLLGNSHADMWGPGIERAAEREGWTLYPLIKLACTPYDLATYHANTDAADTACDDYRRWAFEQIEEIDPDLVVVGSDQRVRVMDDARRSLLPDDQADRAWRDGIEATARRLTRGGTRVAFLGGLMRLEQQPWNCLTEPDATAATCTYDEDDTVREANRRIRRGAEAGGAAFVPVRPAVCADDRCPLVVDHTVVYADLGHLSATYSRQVSRYLAEALDLADRSR